MQKLLLERQRNLAEKIIVNRDAVELPVFNQPGDAADIAVDAFDHELGMRIAEIRSQEAMKVEEALRKIGNGTYGHCEWCGKRISVARLQAMPEATLCMDCQRDHERAENENGASLNWESIGDAREESPEPRLAQEFARG